MTYLRSIQWYQHKADLIWPDGPFNVNLISIIIK